MSNINEKIEKHLFRRKIKKWLSISISLAIFAYLIFTLANIKPSPQREIVVQAIGTKVDFDDFGNINKLKIRTDDGREAFIALPQKSPIRPDSKVLVFEGKTLFGGNRYRFIRYVD